MKFPLGTSSSIVHSAPLLLIDLETEEGVTGRTYLFCYRPSIPQHDVDRPWDARTVAEQVGSACDPFLGLKIDEQ